MKMIIRLIFIIILLPVLFFGILWLVPYPELKVFQQKPYSIPIMDRNGKFLYLLPLAEGERREFVALDQIPSFIHRVFLLNEDRRFYWHMGVDLFAVLRAFYINHQEKKIVSGGSTITMQLARLVSPHGSGIQGKLSEILNALRIEAKLTKKQIFELWLNSLPFGYQATGIKSASQTYFAKDLFELTPYQVMALSIIPRNPRYYNPIDHPEKSSETVEKICRLMSFDIQKDQISLEIKEARHKEWTNLAPHFVNYVDRQLTLETKQKGLPLLTSLDWDLNQFIHNLINTYLSQIEALRITNCAVLVLDNQQGNIVGYQGSRDYNNKMYSGEIDGIHILRQPGSAIKPFLYAYSIENGFTPASILPDIPQDFGYENVYLPQNYNRRFNGPVRLRVALASSLNVPSVYLVTRLGVNNFVNKLLELGFESLKTQSSNIGANIAVGGVEVSLFEMVRAFSVFPMGGILYDPGFLKTDPGKKVTGKSIFDPYTAFIITNILSDNQSRILGFGRNSVLNTTFPAMFKTGTSNQFNNIWCLGSTCDYTIGVWMGNFSGETVIGAADSSIPAEIAVKTLTLLNAGKDKPFCRPEKIKKELICPLSGGIVGSNCSGVIPEYFRLEDQLESCSYHCLENGQKVIHYPIDYLSWIKRLNKIDAFFQTDNQVIYPQIIQPKNNASFYYDPSLADEMQAVRFEILNNKTDENLNVYLNHQFYQTLIYPYDFLLPIRKGTWSIEVKSQLHTSEIYIFVK